MALINCPECNKKVSDQAMACPNCGFQISNYFNILARERQQKEQQERITKLTEEREKQIALRNEKLRKNKKKIIIISSISLFLFIALLVGSIILFNRLQLKTFNSEREMKSYVEGVYIEEHNELLNYRITIKDDYITEEEYGTMKNYPKKGEDRSYTNKRYRYHISEYDYNNGKIITDETTYYYSEKDENANDLTSYNTKTKTFSSQEEYIVKKDDTIINGKQKYKKTNY